MKINHKKIYYSKNIPNEEEVSMKKLRIFMMGIALILVLCVSGCSQEKEAEKIDIAKVSWDEILDQAKGQEVAAYMWGGSEVVNKYMDDYIAPELKSRYDIDFRRVPVTDIADTINQLLAEKEIKKENGSVDILWLNGENFKNAKENNLLAKDIMGKIPNYHMYFDTNSSENKLDFGVETDGYEIPWGRSQFVFTYDTKYVKNPPQNMKELKKFVKENPGKFTYPAPPDFTGSAFIRLALYDITGGYETYLQEHTNDELKKEIAPLWDYLNEIKPYLWRAGETYPESSGKLDQLYASGEVWMTMSYNPLHAEAMVQSGQFSKTTKTFVFENGTLSNTHFWAIPENSNQKAASLVAMNFMVSPEAQIKKLNPKYWGDQMVIDTEKLPEEMKRVYSQLDLGDSTLSSSELEENALPEMNGKYIQLIESEWVKNVAKN